MHIAAIVLSLIVCAIHIYILVVEMFLWDKPAGMKAFNLTPDFAKATKVMAGNQGLYNGFLATGIAWALMAGQRGALLFVLGCVAVAGLYGAATASRKILFVQTVPAGLAMAAVIGLG